MKHDPDPPELQAGTSAPATPRRPIRILPTVAITLLIVGAMWALVGRKLWDDFQGYRQAQSALDDSKPAGYVGLNFRRSYNDRPVDFQAEKDGRKLLFAAKLPDGQIDYYDVTDSDLDPVVLEGGYGRDSIPGVDAPIVKPADSEPVRALRDRQEVFGLALDDGFRAYPKNLVEKIEVVNDWSGSTPIVVVFDRSRQQAQAFSRTLGQGVVTFGTTGYSLGKRPMLYDRKTRSLWLPEGAALSCVCGPLKGTKASPFREMQPATWSEWKGQHPQTTVLFGNDRDKPIPAE